MYGVDAPDTGAEAVEVVDIDVEGAEDGEGRRCCGDAEGEPWTSGVVRADPDPVVDPGARPGGEADAGVGRKVMVSVLVAPWPAPAPPSPTRAPLPLAAASIRARHTVHSSVVGGLVAPGDPSRFT